MARLMEHDYPGNIRELENAIERAVALSRDGKIGPEILPPSLGHRESVARSRIPAEGLDLELTLAEYERGLLAEAMNLAGGVKKRAAQLLSISFRSFRYRHEKLGLDDDSSHES
jgi:two-component system response regulator PilR (NtrC family)